MLRVLGQGLFPDDAADLLVRHPAQKHLHQGRGMERKARADGDRDLHLPLGLADLQYPERPIHFPRGQNSRLADLLRQPLEKGLATKGKSMLRSTLLDRSKREDPGTYFFVTGSWASKPSSSSAFNMPSVVLFTMESLRDISLTPSGLARARYEPEYLDAFL